MPTISRFLGVVIAMYRDDHPPPHFHVRYAEFKASVGIESLEVLDGRLPPRILRMVRSWAGLHQPELWQDWDLAQGRSPLRPIAPLE